MMKEKAAVAAAVLAGAMMAFCPAQAKTLPNQGLPLEEVAKRQARSVHLRYYARPLKISGAAVTVTVRETYPGSYYMALGWSCGYCGIQELSDKSRVLIFSVWDPTDPHDYDAKPEAVREEERAKVLYANSELDVSRFGGEGSGVKAMAYYDWKVGQPVRFKVTTEPDGTNRTAFTCFLGHEGTWYKLATISTMNIDGEAPDFGLLYSFVEDFQRNYKSAQNVRRAVFSDIKTLSSLDGRWHPIDRAWFSGDNTPSENVDAGRLEKDPLAFFLATGGSTTNATTRLNAEIK